MIKQLLIGFVWLLALFAVVKLVLLPLVAAFTLTAAIMGLLTLLVICFVAWAFTLVINRFVPGPQVNTTL